MSVATTIEAAEYAYLQAFMRERSAIVLDPGKEYLVESRLMPLVYSEGLATVGELLVRLRQGKPESLRRKILDAMTNNETWFFRDFYPVRSAAAGDSAGADESPRRDPQCAFLERRGFERAGGLQHRDVAERSTLRCRAGSFRSWRPISPAPCWRAPPRAGIRRWKSIADFRHRC